MREVRVFIASPDDVPHERGRVERVVARLNSEVANRVTFRSVRWEQAFYKAHQTYQAQIPEAAECDVVIVVFGNKLGSPLPEDFPHTMPGGGVYPSGTAYELLTSVAAAEQADKPEVFVFRKSALPHFRLDQKAEWERATVEQARLDAFFKQHFSTPSDASRRSVNKFADTDEFDTKVDALLRQWTARSLRLGPRWPFSAENSPFRGLEPFDARHARVFFGRNRKVQRAIDELLRAVTRESGRPFLLVVGPSGSGKSSLVRAGLVPRLTAPGVVGDVDLWRIAVMRPGGGATAFAALAQALYVRATEGNDAGGFGSALPELEDGPYKSAEQLLALLESASAAATPPILAALDAVGAAEQQRAGFTRRVSSRLLLLVDQLEEIFAKRVDDAQRIGFARLLTLLADTGRVWIVATLRADLYAEMLDQTSPFLALKDTGGAYDLSSPGEAELREILEKSAEVAGLVYEQDPETGERLDDVLLHDAMGADALPLLQFSLKELSERPEVVQTPAGPETRLTFAAYRALGGLDGAIDKVAETAINDPAHAFGPPDLEGALPRLLRRLAEPVREHRVAMTGQGSLTAREVKLSEVTGDERARKLVDVLVRARLLVFGNDASHDASVRLAHERVLTSWQRARKIVQEHRGFFRVKADIEMEQARWLASARRRELLLSGLPLQEAEATLRRYGDELGPELRTYVTLGGRRARRNKTLRATGFVGALVIAVLALGFGVLASNAEQKSSANYAAAKNAADSIVTQIPKSLADSKGIQVDTLDILFQVASSLIDELQTAGTKNDGPIARALQSGFGFTQILLHGNAVPDGAGALERSRSNMLYEFAETYHRSANDLPKALDLAAKSLTIRESLVQAGDRSTQALADVAMAQMELGDLKRRAIEDEHSNLKGQTTVPADYSPVRALFNEALQTLDGLHRSDPKNLDWALKDSKILTDRGDLYRKDGDLAAAAQLYGRAKAVAVEVFDLASKDAKAVRELAWSYRKLGEVYTLKREPAAAIASYTGEVCFRRWVSMLDPKTPLYDVDLGFALAALGGSLSSGVPPDLTAAKAAYFEAMLQWLKLLDDDRSKKLYFEQFSSSLRNISAQFRVLGETTQADLFAGAADDVTTQTKFLFTASDQLSNDQVTRQFQLNDQRRLREAGAMAMIGRDRRPPIDTIKQEFIDTQLPNIQRAADGCWQHLTPAPKT